MKFLISLQWPLHMWQVFAMAPFAIAQKTLLPIRNTHLQFYSVILWIVLFICHILTVAFSSFYIDWTVEGVGNYDTLLAVVLVWFLACVIVGEAIFKLEKQTDFLLQIIRIDFILQRKLHIQIEYNKYQLQNIVLTVIWICITLICVVGVFIVFHVSNDQLNINLWLIYIAPLVIYSIQYHRMILYVYVIGRRYKIINEYIQKICMFQEKRSLIEEILQKSKQMSKVAFTDSAGQLFKVSQLIDVRNIYQMLYESTLMFNDMFRWSLPLCICVDFHRLLVNVFLIFAVWLLRSHVLILIVVILWGTTNIVHLVTLSHVCHSTCSEVNFNR